VLSKFFSLSCSGLFLLFFSLVCEKVCEGFFVTQEVSHLIFDHFLFLKFLSRWFDSLALRFNREKKSQSGKFSRYLEDSYILNVIPLDSQFFVQKLFFLNFFFSLTLSLFLLIFNFVFLKTNMSSFQSLYGQGELGEILGPSFATSVRRAAAMHQAMRPISQPPPPAPASTSSKKVREPGEICTSDEEEEGEEEDFEEDELEDEDDEEGRFGGLEPGEIAPVVSSSSNRYPGLEPGELPPIGAHHAMAMSMPPMTMSGAAPTAAMNKPKKTSAAPGTGIGSGPSSAKKSSASLSASQQGSHQQGGSAKGGVGSNIPSNWAQKWTEDEDQRLISAIETFGENNWKQVANLVGTRDAGMSFYLPLFHHI
jgi:hypothetical protein